MKLTLLKTVACIGLLTLGVTAQAQKFEDLAQTPPLGWNSWNNFACDVNEKLIRETADAMVSSGMKDAGYEYVNIDDCWQGTRDEKGFIQPDFKRFPSGIKALADYVHSKGLKLGIYSDVGDKTCGGYVGSRGHEYQDAQTYASWGIDYVKYDWCNSEGIKPEGAYTTMRNALFAAGRPIILSICEWGDNEPWLWAKDIGHAWRISGDIYPCWDCEHDHGTWSSWGVLKILDMHENLRQYAGPGHWNDMDMMEVGNEGLNLEENRSHFSLWALLASPLIAGNDIRNMTDEVRNVLTNKEVIAVSQDKLGIQGFKSFEGRSVEYWIKPLANKEWAMIILNRSDNAVSHTMQWRSIQKAVDTLSKRTLDFVKTQYAWHDLWHGQQGMTKGYNKMNVPAHGVVMLRFTPK